MTNLKPEALNENHAAAHIALMPCPQTENPFEKAKAAQPPRMLNELSSDLPSTTISEREYQAIKETARAHCGPLAIFACRVVSPWIDRQQRLIAALFSIETIISNIAILSPGY